MELINSGQRLQIVLLSIIVFMMCSFSIIPTLRAASEWPYTLKMGPYLDRIVFDTNKTEDEQVQALLENEVDIIGPIVNPSFAPTLSEAEDIEVATTLRNGYGYLLINYIKYPFNLTAFRRALAFTLDKHAICDELFEGLAEPLDSLVPKINPFSIEGQLPYSYYEANVETGNNLLDSAGFLIDENSGFRNAPNGEPFDVSIEVPWSSSIGMDIGKKTVEALEALKINARVTDYESRYLCRCGRHHYFDIIFLENDFSDLNVDWLASQYWPQYSNAPFVSIHNFLNSTYNTWSDQLLHSIDYDKVYEAAIEMQKVRVYQCPEIILYENMLVSAYRTDRFEVMANDILDGVHSWWTYYKTHLKDSEGGPFGGTLRIGTSLDIDSFNFMFSNSSYDTQFFGSIMYDSLLRRDPTGHNLPWLAESYTITTNDDDPAVNPGNTRLAFNILWNATWTDGTLLTAEDVAFTINYYRDAPGNVFGPDLRDLKMAYAPTQFQVVFEFEGESYWHLSKIANKPIIPKHVFAEIGLDNWNMWDPQPPNEEIVTSGPFNVSEHIRGNFAGFNFTEFTYNPNYFYSDCGCSHDPPPPDPQRPDPRLYFMSGIITGGSLGVIIVAIVQWRETS